MLIIIKSHSVRYFSDSVLPRIQHDNSLLNPVFIEKVQKGLSRDLLEFSAQITGAYSHFL